MAWVCLLEGGERGNQGGPSRRDGQHDLILSSSSTLQELAKRRLFLVAEQGIREGRAAGTAS